MPDDGARHQKTPNTFNAAMKVSGKLTAYTTIALVRARFQVNADMKIEQQVANAGDQVVKETPDQEHQQQLEEEIGGDATQPLKAQLRHQAQVEQPQQQWQHQEQRRSADPMHDRHHAGQRQAICQQQRKVKVAKLRPWLFFCGEAAHQWPSGL